MNITDLYVFDERAPNKYTEPHVVVFVDEPVMEIGEVRPLNNSFQKTPCGPFVAVEYRRYKHKDWELATPRQLSKFNTIGMHQEQLISLVVSNEQDGDEWLMIGVRRLRRLLRQYDVGYHVVVDELSALDGRISWRVDKINPTCLYFPCRNPVEKCVWYSGAHINLCGHHLIQHDQMIRTQMKESREGLNR